MDKKNIINEIKQYIKNYGSDNYLSIHNLRVFSNGYCKYDLMAVWLDDNDDIIIEGVGYNSFKVITFNINELRIRTLYAIMKKIEKHFSEIK